MHGSLAFTGNLNMYLALLSRALPLSHVHRSIPCVERQHFLNQGKCHLSHPLQAAPPVRTSPGLDCIKAILTGSQSMDLKDMHGLKQAFPQSRCILYYGASELQLCVISAAMK